MVMELGSFSNGSTGNTTVSLNGSETPSFIEFWTGPRSGTTETSNISSFGSVDITNAVAAWQSNLADSTHFQTKGGAGASATTPCLTHYAIVSGAVTKVVEIKYVSCAAGSFTVNITTANSSYPIFMRVYG